MREFEGRYTVIPVPNITNIFYGRDVGYTIERLEMDSSVEAISATGVRSRLLGQTIDPSQIVSS